MGDNIPPYAMLDLDFGDCEAALTIMSRGKRFHITFIAAEGDEEQINKFNNLQERMDVDPHALEQLMDWMVEPCSAYIDELAPASRDQPPSLAEYYSPETIFFKLSQGEEGLKATRCPDDASVVKTLIPRVPMSDQKVLEAISEGIPLMLASQLVPDLPPDAHKALYDEVPRRVRSISKDTLFYFKGAYAHEPFSRELEVLLRLRSETLPPDLHVSRLGGLVMHEDGISILGLLIVPVPDSKILYHASRDASTDQCREWMRQIRDIVEMLHRAGIVWGDVKPDNILVDANGHVWVIDFGGGCAVGWVDSELAETKEGDLQGLLKLEKFLGV